jgi:hypothetical protein
MVATQRADAKPNVPRQPVVIVDLDGCLVANPAEACLGVTITDIDYWTNHWNNPMASEPNYELVQMVRTLGQAGWKIVILTARPESFRQKTEQFLRRIELECSLIMRSDLAILPSAEWKMNVISHMITLGWDVKLAIEDYKPNADAIRSVVPVLLYERKK